MRINENFINFIMDNKLKDYKCFYVRTIKDGETKEFIFEREEEIKYFRVHEMLEGFKSNTMKLPYEMHEKIIRNYLTSISVKNKNFKRISLKDEKAIFKDWTLSLGHIYLNLEEE